MNLEYKSKVIKSFSDNAEGYHDKATIQRKVSKILVVIVSSDKGLCGSFNSSLIKEFHSFCNRNSGSNSITVLPIGKKAYDFFKKSEYELILDYWEELNGFSYEKSSEICDFIINSFIESKFDKVTIIYNEFKNVAVQKTVSENFLPVSQENDSEDSANNNYIFEPEKNKIIDNLIESNDLRKEKKQIIEKYINANKGATNKILKNLKI